MTARYSPAAETQIEAIGVNALYNAVLQVCEEIFSDSPPARLRMHLLTTTDGPVYATAVPGLYPWKVFWSRHNGLLIEAVFPYEF